MQLLILRGDMRIICYTYEVPGIGVVRWDITKAQKLVEQGKTIALVEVPRSEMMNIARRNTWDPKKLDQVDPEIPGIAAPLVFEQKVMYTLIDGNHRNARCVRDCLPFSCHLLSDEAARECLIDGPAELLPWNYRVEEPKVDGKP